MRPNSNSTLSFLEHLTDNIQFEKLSKQISAQVDFIKDYT
jgi:hypothetical protein